MNLIELFNKNFSRKAAVAIITIAALTYIANIKIEAGADSTLIKWAIVAISLIGALYITAQAINDWRNPQNQEPEPASGAIINSK